MSASSFMNLAKKRVDDPKKNGMQFIPLDHRLLRYEKASQAEKHVGVQCKPGIETKTGTLEKRRVARFCVSLHKLTASGPEVYPSVPLHSAFPHFCRRESMPRAHPRGRLDSPRMCLPSVPEVEG
jgi:hypothetical protein